MYLPNQAKPSMRGSRRHPPSRWGTAEVRALQIEEDDELAESDEGEDYDESEDSGD